MRHKEHKVGDIIYLRGIKGRVTAVDSVTGKATVHAHTSGNLLGSAPAYKDIKKIERDGFKWPENTGSDKSTFTVDRNPLYNDRDFDSDATPVTDEKLRAREEGRFSKYVEDYWDALKAEDEEEVAFVKKAVIYQCSVIGASPELVLSGKCGIDGCAYPSKGGFRPDHFALSSCRSGGHNHCTCDSCF